MRQINDTLQIGELLETTAFQDLKGKNMTDVIKHSTVFSFWDGIVGKKFSKFTHPYAIKNSKLFISAKSPIVVQELSLYKTKLLQKINSYSKPLGIQVSDLVFNYKNFNMVNAEKSLKSDSLPVEILQEQLNSIELDENIKENIKNNISKIKFLNEQQKNNFIFKILSTYKAKIYRDDL